MKRFYQRPDFEGLFSFVITRFCLVIGVLLIIDFTGSWFCSKNLSFTKYSVTSVSKAFSGKAEDIRMYTNDGKSVLVKEKLFVNYKAGQQIHLHISPLFDQVLSIDTAKKSDFFQASIYGSFFFIPLFFLLLLLNYFWSLIKLNTSPVHIVTGMVCFGVFLWLVITLS